MRGIISGKESILTYHQYDRDHRNASNPQNDDHPPPPPLSHQGTRVTHAGGMCGIISNHENGRGWPRHPRVVVDQAVFSFSVLFLH